MIVTLPDYVGIDVYDEPDPVIIAVPVRLYNNMDYIVYIKITAVVPNAEWTVTEVTDTAGIASNNHKDYTMTIQRTKPTTIPTSETVTFKVEVYRDSSLTQLLTTYLWNTQFDFIDRSQMTVVDESMFEGTLDGWTVEPDYNYGISGYGIGGSASLGIWGSNDHHKVYKTFDLTSYTNAWFELHVKRSGGTSSVIIVRFIDESNGNEIKSYMINVVISDYRRYVLRVPDSIVGKTVRILLDVFTFGGSVYVYLDDFRVIAQ